MVIEPAARPDRRSFYEQALSEAERADMAGAMAVHGFDEEIAVLRLRLRAAVEKHPEDMALMLRGLDVLRRMVAAKYGLSRKDERNLKAAFARETLRRMRERGEDEEEDGGDEDE